MVDSLHAAGLLSDFGLEVMGRDVYEGWAPIYTQQRIYTPAFDERSDSLSAGQLLGMLYQAYLQAYSYRLGTVQESEVLKEWQRFPNFNMDMVRSRAFQAAVEQRKKANPGYRFERAVLQAAKADTTLKWADYRDAWSFDDSVSDTLVPANRSVFGPAVKQTLVAVSDVGLIPRDTFLLYRRELEIKGIYPDYLLLKRLAEAAGTRETEEQRIKDRRSAIRFLGEREMIPSESVPALLRDSTLLRTLDDRALYAYIQPQIALTLTEPSGTEGLVRQLWRQLCDYDPELCHLRLELVEDTDNTTDAFTRYWLVGERGNWRSERSTEIYTYPDSDNTPWYQLYSADIFLQPFNAYLASVNAPYRLFNLPMEADAESESDRVGLRVFPLGSAAARAIFAPRLREAMDFLRGPETETFFSRQEANIILDKLEDLRYLSTLDKPTRVAARSCLETVTLKGLPDLFRCLPGLYATNPDAAELRDLPGKLYMLPATAYDLQDIYIRLEQPVFDFLSEQFPFSLYPVE